MMHDKARPHSTLAEGWNTPDVSADARAALLGDGNQRKNRGRSAEMSIDSPPTVLLDLMGDDQLASGATITLGVRAVQSQMPGLYPYSSTPPLVARVDWGVDGSAFHADVDMRQGATFTLSASSLRLQAMVDELALVPIAGAGGRVAWPPAPCIVSASAGYYTARCTATRTVYARVDALATGTVFVPAFARRVRLTSTAPSGALTAAVFATIFPPVVAVSSSSPIDIELPNGSNSIVIQNMDADDGALVAAVFELDL